MRYSVAAAVVSLVVAAGFSAALASTRTSDPSTLTVHEWGTFTSVAGQDGSAVEWLALAGPSDLPCFVERSAFNVKGAITGTVRMETPVLYFYAPRETMIDVQVRFRTGVITEWFPHASVSQTNGPMVPGSASTIMWKHVKVSPGGAQGFPVEEGTSHYYTARQTDAAPVLAGSQTEKFLFYRGVARFALPIAATVDAAARVSLRTQGPDGIDNVLLFSNDHGRIRYEMRGDAGREIADEASTDDVAFELQKMLLASGLYPEEASAMIQTWRDSWFEAGTRLFYIVPSRVIDSVLPLDVNPPPSDLTRVFVARTELFTPAAERELRIALLENDIASLRKYGRFLDVIGRRVIANASDADRTLLEMSLQNAYAAMTPVRDACHN
jgi:hypothetical protein